MTKTKNISTIKTRPKPTKVVEANVEPIIIDEKIKNDVIPNIKKASASENGAKVILWLILSITSTSIIFSLACFIKLLITDEEYLRIPLIAAYSLLSIGSLILLVPSAIASHLKKHDSLAILSIIEGIICILEIVVGIILI